ncbi:MAG: BMP family ABC transporter substrate-binding protein [Acidimicrobiia bacterium]
MTSRPTGTVTFLLTDIEASTRLWEQSPRVMNEAVAWHDEVLRRIIERNGGFVFTTAGDAFAAAFSDPMLAAAAAVEAQHEIGAREWEEVGALRVRMSLDTGIAQERDNDYFGPPVNRAARILSLADGEQVLASHTTADLLRHHLDEGIRLENLGERKLKDVEQPERVFAVEYGPARPDEAPKPGRAVIRAGIVIGAAALAVVLAVLLLGGSTPPEVGLVYGGRTGFGTYDDLLASGLEQAGREYDFEAVEIAILTDPEEDFRRLAETGADLIISGGSLWVDGFRLVAEDFPDLDFAIVDTTVDLPNVLSVVFAEEEGSYLVGAAAALKSETGVIGFVGGFQTPLIERFQAGYEAGARAAQPDIEIIATYVGSFFDPELGQQAGTALYRNEADVVYHAAGGVGFGLFQAAHDLTPELGRHLWAIGVDTDQWLQAPPSIQPHILTSMIKRADVAIRTTIADYVEGTFEPGVRVLGLADEALDFSVAGGFVADVANVVGRLKLQIIDGVIEVPVVPTVEPIPTT